MIHVRDAGKLVSKRSSSLTTSPETQFEKADVCEDGVAIVETKLDKKPHHTSFITPLSSKLLFDV